MNRTAGFQKWHYMVETPERAPVFPDGCRDVLIIQETGKRAKVVLTDFDLRPRTAELSPGTEITGYRLRPGSQVDLRVLNAIESRTESAEEILGNELAMANGLEAAIVALTLPGATVQSVSTDLGVAVRTLQRRFRDQGLPPPEYWRLLSRARQAAGLLAGRLSLAEIAFLAGFSDQAHMTREFLRWFGGSPAQLRRSPAVLDLLAQPALGNWTGEQISTR